MKMNRKTLVNYILIIVGLLMFSAYIWLRFIRLRLPRDIPFNLSILGLIILIEICTIYGYILFALLRKDKEPNPIVVYIIDQVYKPLIAFDNFIKDFPSIQSIYPRFMVFVAYKLNFAIKDTSIFYVIFYIFPRLVLVTALMIDTFYFHQLYYLYKVLLIGILLFLHRYIIYSFKHTKELLIVQKEPYMTNISMEYIPGVIESDEDDEDDDDIPPTMSIPLRKFIELQTKAIVDEDKQYDYMIYHTQKYWEEVRILYKLGLKDDVPMSIVRLAINKEKLQIDHPKNLIQISVMLEYYNMTVENKRYKNLKKLITLNYLLSWSYILIMSGTMELTMKLIEVLSIYNNIENPFIN